MGVTVSSFFEKVKSYNEESLDCVKKAYYLAEQLHKGQYRQSGEEYITHPLTVAYILADMYVDCDTLCAALLHDTVEDTDITLEDIRELFNDDVATLVDGVTKISKMSFSTRTEVNYANIKKLVTSITKDIRIIIIKLADRLHNMRTLEYKSIEKQKENSHETLDIFVPLAHNIGAYKIKNELEDLAFKHINPNDYNRISSKRENLIVKNEDTVLEMKNTIRDRLNDIGLNNSSYVIYKNIYGIYKNLIEGENINYIHDLIAFALIVDKSIDCYTALGVIHKLYLPLNDRFRDYISRPKTNMYKSLHTSVYGLNNTFVQMQIRTDKMDKVANNGICAYWDMYRGEARKKMQADLEKKFQFFNSLVQINDMFPNPADFAHKISDELFSDKVYVYTSSGMVIELPSGSTIVDFVYKIGYDNSTVCAALVNNQLVDLDYVLKNYDQIILIDNKYVGGPKVRWAEFAKTSFAKKRIKEQNNGEL